MGPGVPASQSAMNPQHKQSTRIVSVDILRGLTMLVMIFVNDLAEVKGLPWWTYHMPGHANGMTYVDVVFPAFLFILGMAIPLAVRKRLELGDSQWQLWIHVFLRSFSLVVLGLLLANASLVDPGLTGIPRGLWACLGLIGAILYWNVYPRQGGPQRLYRGLKYGGLCLLVLMFALFRRHASDGSVAWLDFRYWEILGLIGRAYLAACILYIPLRKKAWAPAALLAGLTLMSIASRLGWLPFLRHMPHAIWPFDSGELPSIVMAGIVCSTIFLESGIARTVRRKLIWGVGFTVLLVAVGAICTPLGISKNRATPTWCLYSAAIGTVLFMALYWIADVKGIKRWAAFVKPAGSNTLLTYLLPDLFYYSAGIAYLYLPAQLNAGWPGAVRSVVFTGLILAAAAVLTRWKVRLQL